MTRRLLPNERKPTSFFREFGTVSGILVSRRPGHMASMGRKGGRAVAVLNRRRANGQYKARGEA